MPTPTTTNKPSDEDDEAVETVLPKHKEKPDSLNKPSRSQPKTRDEPNSKSENYEEYFSAVKKVENERIQMELADSEMNRYFKFLQITKLERELGLARCEIDSIRKMVVAQAPITDLPVLEKARYSVSVVDDPTTFATSYGFEESE